MKLSVLMITYNHETFIAQAIQSVLNQRVDFDYEIVIGEDCSKDTTRSVILEFQRRHPGRIVLLQRQRNVGAMRNFVETLAACHGEYLAILEGDDYWICPNKLKMQVNFLDGHRDWNICCSRAITVVESAASSAIRVPNGHIFPSPQDERATDGLDLGGLLPVTPKGPGTYTLGDLVSENFIPTCTVVYRRSAVPRLPAWFLRGALGDFPLHALVAGEKKIELLDNVTAAYRIHPAGMWSSRTQASQIRANASVLTALSRYLGEPYAAKLSASAARSYFHLATVARQQGNRADAAACVAKCLRNGGYSLPEVRTNLNGLAWYVIFGSWLPAISRAKRSVLR